MDVRDQIEPSMMAARDRVRRARALEMSPRERLAAMWRLIAEAKELLARSPAGLDHFRRRNFRIRAVARPCRNRSDDT
jgi:hypothetical protein